MTPGRKHDHGYVGGPTLDQIQFPFAIEMDWATPELPNPEGLKRFSERKVCARVLLGEAGLGDYECFDPTSTLSGYYGRFGLSLAEGNYIQLCSEITGRAPFEAGTPYVPFGRLPPALRAHFAAGGRLYWSKCNSISVLRQWQRLHAEFHLRPGESPVNRVISQAEGVSLSRADIAARIVNWEYLRDSVTGAEEGKNLDLLDLEELGKEIEATIRRAEWNATGSKPTYRLPISLAPAESSTFTRTFSAPLEAMGPVDETYNQMREILEFHQVWFINAIPFDLKDGLDQPGVFAISMPLHSGAQGTNEIVSEMDVFAARHFAQA